MAKSLQAKITERSKASQFRIQQGLRGPTYGAGFKRDGSEWDLKWEGMTPFFPYRFPPSSFSFLLMSFHAVHRLLSFTNCRLKSNGKARTI